MIQTQIAKAKPDDITLIHTGWSTYFGTDETPDESHPGVGFPVHHLIAESAGVISENMTNLV